jgi:hypothetical protein
VGQPCALGHRQQTLLAQRTLAHTDPSLVRCVQRKWVDPQFRRYRPQYVFCVTMTIRSLKLVRVDVFKPLFEVTKDPSSHPKLHIFLQRVIGFDTVDDESKTERRYHKKFPYPKLWNYRQSPPYSYWSVILALKGRAFLLTCSKGLLHVCQYGKPQ